MGMPTRLDGIIDFWSPINEEMLLSSAFLEFLEVYLRVENVIFTFGSLSNDLSLRISDKGFSGKREHVFLANPID